MLFKILVVVLFIANIVALGAALRALLTDQKENTGRTAKYLTIRVVLAVLLILVVAIGLWTGQLGASAPWLTY
jgi:hypothetical protein